MDPALARPVVFLPGGVLPAAMQYEPLMKVLGDAVRPIFKDLEVYRDDAPPPDYELDVEVEALRHVVDDANLSSIDIVAYSGGGAVALAFTAKYPERVRTLAVCEPAVIPGQDWIREAGEFWTAIQHAMTLPAAEQMREFVRVHLRPGVPMPPPPSGSPPPWMARRPAGLRALVHAFTTYDLDSNRYRLFRKPVYVAIGDLSDSLEERKASAMANLFVDFRLEVYEGRHHFDPPQRAEPERFARALAVLWTRGA
jgi:pimeloyl-ACP methyl ester carboxylesterase